MPASQCRVVRNAGPRPRYARGVTVISPVCVASPVSGRDPRIDPAVGDVLAQPEGGVWRVLDVFYSVDYETGRHRGLLVEVSEGDQLRRVWVSLERFRRSARQAQARSKALKATDWEQVRSIAAPLVCAAMTAGHWPPMPVSTDH